MRATSGGQNVVELVGRIYDAALDDSLWPRTLTHIEQAVGASIMHLLIVDKTSGLPTFGVTSRYPEANTEFVDVYASMDERWPRILALPNACPTVHETLYRGEESRKSPVYNEFLKKYDAQSQTITRIDGPDDTDIVFSAIRPLKSGPFEHSETSIIQRLLPSISKAVQVRQTLARAEAHRDPMARLIEREHLGVILLDRHANILQANDSAIAILSRGDGLLDAGRKLAVAHRDEDAVLQRRIASAIAVGLGLSTANGDDMMLSLPSSDRFLYLLIMPIPMSQADFGAKRAVAAVLVQDPHRPADLPKEVVSRVYGLTAAEARLAASFAETASLKDSAEALGITEGTARQYLKRIFQKTDTKSQAELMKLLVRQSATI